MTIPTEQSESTGNRAYVLLEIAAVFAVFFIQGATPVPTTNEPYYLGKAIHFWNPDWAAGDFFLNTADSHTVFFVTFGWLSLLVSPPAMAWIGRLVTWWLLAWSWRRLSFAAAPRPWFSILTAALFAVGLDHFHMAGEWVIGGVEAKGFAYVFVFLGLEALIHARWNRMWLLFGAASAFHVLAGGWSVVAGGVAWLLNKGDRPSLRSMIPSLLGGFLLALPGLIPALLLDYGAEGEVVRDAHWIYVYDRLPHHLSIAQIPARYIIRFLAITCAWGAICWFTFAWDKGLWRLWGFVIGALAIATVGVGISCFVGIAPYECASLLRFYWYRLSDVMVPMGVAMGVGVLILRGLDREDNVAKIALTGCVLVGAFYFGNEALKRLRPTPPPAVRIARAWWSDTADPARYVAWRQACDWIVHSGEIPADAVFLTPERSQTFKWYTGRAEVVNQKDVPQDAGAILEWWQRRFEVYRGRRLRGRYLRSVHYPSLAIRHERPLTRLAQKYGADYLITDTKMPVFLPDGSNDVPLVRRVLDFEQVYCNDEFAIYRLPKKTPAETKPEADTAETETPNTPPTPEP